MKPSLPYNKALQVKFIFLLTILCLIGISAFSQTTHNQSARQYAADFFNMRQQGKTGLKSAVSAAALK